MNYQDHHPREMSSYNSLQSQIRRRPSLLSEFHGGAAERERERYVTRRSHFHKTFTQGSPHPYSFSVVLQCGTQSVQIICGKLNFSSRLIWRGGGRVVESRRGGVWYCLCVNCFIG